jgi:hypothetical protein
VQGDNGIGVEGGKALGEALKVNNSVNELDLVSAFLFFLSLFVLRVFCCEESGRLTCAVQYNNGIGAEGGKALGEALKVNNSVKELDLVSAFLFFLSLFCFARVLLLRGVRAADVCGAGGQRHWRQGRQGAWGSAESQYQSEGTESCKCILVVFVAFLFCACFVVSRSQGG